MRGTIFTGYLLIISFPILKITINFASRLHNNPKRKFRKVVTMKNTIAVYSYYSNVTGNVTYSYNYFVSKPAYQVVIKEVSLNRAVESFIEHLNYSYASNTCYCYARDLRRLLKRMGNININQMSGEILNDCINQICNFGKKTSSRSAATKNRIKSVYRSFFKWCYKKNYTIADLSKDIRLTRSLSCATVPISIEETICLLNTIYKSDDTLSKRDKALFAVYAFSGIRRFEALALRICDYDTTSKILFLPKSKRSSKNMQVIPSILSQILNEYLNDLYIAGVTDISSPLFSGWRINTYLSGRQVSNRFEKWKKISGIRSNLTIHSFRAGYASELYKNSKDPLLVSFALGHCSPISTKRYINEELFNIKSVVERSFKVDKLSYQFI